MNTTIYIFLLASFSLLAIASNSIVVLLIVLASSILSAFYLLLVAYMNTETYYPNH